MSIEEKKKAWQAAAEKSIAKAPERKSSFRNSSDIELDRCFAPGFDYPGYEENLGFPGQYPFTRGVQPTMYRGRFWTMRQYAGFGNAAESNERYKYLLSAGQTGLSIAFDLPTQMGYDSDASMSRGEVGKVGVAIDSLADMEILFDGIPLDKVSTSMTINSTASILLAMYIAVAEKQGVSADKISGTIQNDILKEYMARGTYIYPPKESMRIITDIFAYCKDNVPKWNTISISGYHIREAGSSAVQEVAFTLADGIAYVEAAVKAGLDVDEFAPRLAFFFNAHNDLLEEVAKFRAARRMWSRIMRDRFKAKDPRSQMLRFHTQTAGCTLTAQQPDNNIMRVTLQALAAVLGGTQSLHTNSRDEALALPTEESVRIALRTQQVIAYESGVADSIDPLAGSFMVEALTDKIEAQALAYIEKIDALGGAVEAISRGFQQKEIQDSAYAYQRAIEKNETIIVGVNKFTVQEGAPQGLLKVTGEVEVKQKASLGKMKEGRDNAKVEASLKALEQAARGTQNLMPFILDAVKTYATLGEIANVMRGVFGIHRETVVL
ncbi:LOW QUALITY PROTEIN: (R)-methylmalonyl-CoA mutase, isobutyryl-CoA mutase-like catalytic subunit [Citrifermentans bemidjiense Bem]|uniref:(R)-methylmalonyl-CoA mutase, isobutyryl-CoA mutase-like catalytic subunit n=1 Tax=Citrifermentans bemidjiense (strain ATCC BAA-1014 / DSM 16622 / JCM 12645 / Bem) TaxID=404380 RepID=E1P670_CITBB|nr:LOW QUALITY PROTEIN: (R)-methylmalonyl-CoA mutase, isobutyryl-CoA mutase-like catalytic subunit [Citrifermentans bemidjiense Bem]